MTGGANVSRTHDDVFSDLALHRNVHLIRTWPLEIRRHWEEASSGGECSLVWERRSPDESCIWITERSSQRDASRICLLVDVGKGQPGGEGLEVGHRVPLVA